MSSNESIITVCKSLRIKHAKFDHYHRPAQIIALLSIIIPLAIIVPTAPNDENGDQIFADSPYASHSGAIFLALVVLAAIFSKKASPFKITTTQKWTVLALTAYEKLLEYNQNPTIQDYQIQAKEKTIELVSDIKTKIGDVDDKIKWLIPFVNSFEGLIDYLEKNIAPSFDSTNKEDLRCLETFLINLMDYFLHPTEERLKKLLDYKFTTVPIPSSELPSKFGALKNTSIFRIGMFGAFVVVGIITFNIATYIDIDKNSAFLGSIGIIGALVAAFIGYLKK